MSLKAVILIGGPLKGTRFRPLSLDIPKPLFPVAGHPMIYHLIESCAQVDGLVEILLIGSYQLTDQLSLFIGSVRKRFTVQIRYYQEFAPLGTAGGIYHFRDQILSGNPEDFFVLNCDVCGDFPLKEMVEFHRSFRRGDHASMREHYTILGTEATRQQSLNYGCIVSNKSTGEVLHYVEKPETFVSTTINCGVYLFSIHIFQQLLKTFEAKQNSAKVGNHVRELYESNLPPTYRDESISLEHEILTRLAGTEKLFVYHTTRFWSQIKSAAATIYANRHYLKIYLRTHPDWLSANSAKGPKIIGDVFIHPTASIDPTAVIGPNVSIGKGAVVSHGARIRESIVLDGAQINEHACIIYSIIGWNSSIGAYTRVEGTPNDPNPNKPFSKIEVKGLFDTEGRLNPSITVIGSLVQVPAEIVILNTIVLPHKDIASSQMNQIIL